MPRNKDFKRLVRARMTKTGESYTTARAQVIRKSKPRSAPSPVVAGVSRSVGASRPADYAALAGVSDAAVKKNTGCAWERWVRALDHHGAATMPHRNIVRIVSDFYKIDGWWSQTVTVGYERIKGRRARGQRLDGTYEVSSSRTFGVPVEVLFDAWATPRARRRWLDGPSVKVRTATRPRTMRLGWTDGTIVAAWFMDKGKAKSAVALAHTRLPDGESAARLKTYWSKQLDRLREALSGAVTRSTGKNHAR